MATDFARVEIFLAGDVPGAWRFVCPCCEGLHALTEAQVKGADYSCYSQDLIGNPKENDIDCLLDSIGMVSVPKCKTTIKTPRKKERQQPRTDWEGFDPYAY